MVTKLVKHGDSLALIIDAPTLAILGIQENTPLEVSTSGHQLVIEAAASDARARRVKAALAETNRVFAPALKRLAE